MNYISAWLYLIGTPARAAKLLKLLPRLKAPYSSRDDFLAAEMTYPAQCPTNMLFGAKESGRLYGDSALRPALDAWDTGALNKLDLQRFCLWVMQGRYQGPVFEPRRYNADMA